MILFPPAKINLGLNVVHKREDNFHEIDSCMVAIPFYDVLEILPSESFVFEQTGLSIVGDSTNNLVFKAYQLLQSKFNLDPVHLHLQKHIPMGAGLGGGSSDATYTLIGLNQFFKLNLTSSEIQKLVAQLGSDCPFFATKGPQLASGRGEILTSFALDLEGLFLKIVNPGLHIGTQEAYSNIRLSRNSTVVSDILCQPIESWKNELKNDFETSAFLKYPALKKIKESVYQEGAIYASMTGSGSTLYGIYKNEPKPSFPYYFERIMKL